MIRQIKGLICRSYGRQPTDVCNNLMYVILCEHKQGVLCMATEFTQEQIIQLRSNPYTYKVTARKIFFTKEFKQAVCEKRQEGLTLREAIAALGYDPKVFGEKRIEGIRNSINKAIREGGGFREGIRPHNSILDEECPEVTKENFLRMHHELQYMKQEIEFLKKISSPDDTVK